MKLTGLEIVQIVTSVAAVIAAFYTIYLQRREMSETQQLSAMVTLFEYYNAKISSLRESIIRDTGKREMAHLDSLNVRQEKLEKLLAEHDTLRTQLQDFLTSKAKKKWPKELHAEIE